MIKPPSFSITPSEVRYDNNLKPNAKLLFGEIYALSSKKGYCWASNEYFSNLYDVTKPTVSLWISQLAQKGYIRTEIQTKFNQRHIYINLSSCPSLNSKSALKKIETPIKKIQKHISTINNKNENVYAFEFFRNHFPHEFVEFSAKYGFRIPDIEKFEANFNAAVVKEHLTLELQSLQSRMIKMALNWRDNSQATETPKINQKPKKLS